ncbi:MAG: hypothetical protein U1E63_05510 [Burkholderiales bacterium]
MQPRQVEVMRVVGPGVFVDAGDDGYYLVLRSVSRRARTRDVDISFFGPFPAPAQAVFLATSARALGLTAPEPESPHTDVASGGEMTQEAAVAPTQTQQRRAS